MSSTTYRLIGTTDDVIDCDRCGKPDLRATVILEFLDRGEPTGEVTYFGSTCAARALAERGVRATPAAIRRVEDARWAQTMLDHYGIGADEHLTEQRIAEVLPAWRAANRSLDGLRPLDEARRMFLDSVTRHQGAVRAVA